ncbi:MAG: hypothetical protein ACRD4Y_13025, partial [Candidatus Acidiferrales bacterium]
MLVLSIFAVLSAAQTNSPARRELAKEQFDRAESQRQALEAKPENARTVKEYASLVSSYKRVYLIT